VARLLVDTGFFVALYRRRDALHANAVAFLRTNRSALVSAAPVVVETCYFLDAAGKTAFLEWLAGGAVTIAEVPVEGYPALAGVLRKYRNLDIDFTDAALLWLAELLEVRAILTVDARDFAAFRLKGRRKFEPVPWYG